MNSALATATAAFDQGGGGDDLVASGRVGLLDQVDDFELVAPGQVALEQFAGIDDGAGGIGRRADHKEFCRRTPNGSGGPDRPRSISSGDFMPRVRVAV